MSSLEYTVSESVHRRYGQIVALAYEYEEIQREIEHHFLTEKQDLTQQSRTYKATVKRDDYERMISKYLHGSTPLSFDSFVHVLRPFMMGTYANDELEEAFRLLDKDGSGTIEVDELAAFLPIIHSDVTKEALLRYIDKVDSNADQKLNFQEFSDLILRGIGRDIVCRHI